MKIWRNTERVSLSKFFEGSGHNQDDMKNFDGHISHDVMCEVGFVYHSNLLWAWHFSENEILNINIEFLYL